MKSKFKILSVNTASKIPNYPLDYSNQTFNGFFITFQTTPKTNNHKLLLEEILEIKKSFETKGVRFKKIEKRDLSPRHPQLSLSSIYGTLNILMEYYDMLHQVSIGITSEYVKSTCANRMMKSHFNELDESIISRLLKSRYGITVFSEV